jgi:four helix bundle protein
MKTILETKSKNLALEAISFSKLLRENKIWNVENQFIRSSTAIGALVAESQSSESRADFIHKLKIASKEVKETFYWLDLIKEGYSISPPDSLCSLLIECDKMINSSIATAKKNEKMNQRMKE